MGLSNKKCRSLVSYDWLEDNYEINSSCELTGVVFYFYFVSLCCCFQALQAQVPSLLFRNNSTSGVTAPHTWQHNARTELGL